MGVNGSQWWESTVKIVPECSASLLLRLTLMGTDIDLEGSRVLVERVLPVTRITGGFPARGSTKR